MKCPYCNCIIPDNSDFCDNCGSFIEPPAEAKKEEVPNNPQKINFSDFFQVEIPTAQEIQSSRKKRSTKNHTRIFSVILAVLACFLVVSVIYKAGRRRSIAGIGEPIQEETTGYIEMNVAGYEVSIYPQYTYEIEALVVHTKNYPGFGLGNKLSPRDIALAWGKVAEYNEDINFHWKQSGRWVSWSVKSYTEVDKIGGVDYVSSHLSNNHLIPSNNSVRRKIKKIRKGDHIKIKGYLVNVDAENKNGKTFFWNSSTTRDDTGDGACEVIYVTDVIWLD